MKLIRTENKEIRRGGERWRKWRGRGKEGRGQGEAGGGSGASSTEISRGPQQPSRWPGGSFARSAAPSQGEDDKRGSARERKELQRKQRKGKKEGAGQVFQEINSQGK